MQKEIRSPYIGIFQCFCLVSFTVGYFNGFFLVRLKNLSDVGDAIDFN